MATSAEFLRVALAERYRVERELGRGGMATVYLATDLRHHRPVVLKVLHAGVTAATDTERFLREIEIAAHLTHPHILPLHDSGAADGLLFYVMPHVPGGSLRARLERDGRLPVAEAVRIAREVAAALAHAHANGVVHRDVKPENILLHEDGSATVADFGIAAALDGVLALADDTRLTPIGISLGTPAYVSPEQGVGERVLDGRSDLYSLGCVLYEMLCGAPPFTGTSAVGLIARRLIEPPPPLHGALGEVPPQVEAALQRVLARDPAGRFATAAEFGAALAPREEGAEAPEARSPVAPGPARARSRRGVGVAAAGAVVLLALAAAPFALRRAPAPSAPSGSAALAAPSGSSGAVRRRTALAVLPFQNLSADPAHAYFAGGLHDELLTQLAQVPALSLRGRTSVMAYAGTTRSIREIAAELRVGTLVEGSVQVVGDRLRVNVQLIDAATDAHLWAERYDRTLDDAFAIQSDVAERVVVAVGAMLDRRNGAGPFAAPPTANAEAYRLYLQGREYLRRPGYVRQDVESAQQLFTRAVALDPEFALARAALSQVHGRMYWMAYDPSPRRAALQREEAEAALRLAPHLPQAHAAMGLAHYWGRRDYRRALDEFATASKGMSSDVWLVSWIGYVHRRLGNWGEALAAFERAAVLDPLDANVFADLGAGTLLSMRRYADAVRACDRALSLAPDLHSTAVLRGLIFVHWQGRLDSLRAALDHVPRDASLGTWGTGNAQRALLLHWERRADSLLQVVGTAGVAAFGAQDFFLPTSLYAAWAHRLRGDAPRAHAAFDSALVLADSVVAALPGDWRPHAARGLALAGLGRREEARREARWLRESAVYREDAVDGALLLAPDRARILAQVGDADAALDEIDRLLARASPFSVHTLRLDPLFDPIREHPRYGSLLAKYAGR